MDQLEELGQIFGYWGSWGICMLGLLSNQIFNKRIYHNQRKGRNFIV